MIVDRCFDLLDRLGRDRRYGDEAVSQLEHALQCAWLAERDGAPASLITAALLHDIGHLLQTDKDAVLRGEDLRHEIRAAEYLKAHFADAVTAPIRQHVAAKRYLTAVDPAYARGLSPASVRSLEVQGGPFTRDDAHAFLTQPFAGAAIQLRRWDDLAKVAGRATPNLHYFRAYAEQSLKGTAASSA